MQQINEEIRKSLDTWGDHPVFIEINQQNQPTYTSAEQFKDKIND